MTIERHAIAYLFDRIPALRDLRGAARIEAEQAIANAVAAAIEAYIADCADADRADVDMADVDMPGGPP